MTNIKIMLWFDTEDYITDEAEEALLGLLNLLDSRNIKGIFKIVGEKARRLKEHNRTDILEKLSHHEIGYHTNFHSLHPTVSQYSENFNFVSGAEEFARREGAGLDDLTRITGMTSQCYGQAGYSWAPQSFPVLKKWGIPLYIDVHDQITLDNRPFWYGGLLNLTDMKGIMRMDLKENGLEEGIKEFDQLYEELSTENVGLVSIYYHPCEFSNTAFWDAVNYNNGHNTPREQWKPAPLRPQGEMEYYLEMLGKFIDYTISKENVEYITSEQAFALEASNQNALTPSDLRKLAANTTEALSYQVHHDFTLSAADLHSVFRNYLLGQPLKPGLLYGPGNDVDSDPVVSVRVADIKKAIAVDYPSVLEFKQLPDVFLVASHRINPVDLTCTMAKIIEKGLDDEDRVEVVKGVLKAKEHAKDIELWGPRWSPFPQDLKVPNLIRISKLQTWTLKPAIF